MRLFLPCRRAASALVASILAALAVAGPGPAAAQATGRPPAAEPARPAASLDDLFERLAKAKDEDEAKGIATLIERRWARSGSDTADLLLSRAGEAARAKNHALAIELLDRVIALRPGWIEAWNRRAIAFYMLDDTVAALADIRQVLTMEPRHFGAWAGLGQIYMAGGDRVRALDAFRKAKAIHPHLETLQTLIDRLTPEVDGRDI